MSSLAASKADNFYYPPEWRPDFGGISKFQGSNGANQYQKYGIIRFELPFDGWCLGCGRHMSKGLRFNAKKENAGKYLSTTIFSFDMKCYSCDQRFLILTDPQNSTYEFREGLRKHEQEYEANEELGIVEVGNDELKQKLNADPMFKLQHLQEDDIRAKSEREHMSELLELQQKTKKKDYDANSLLRQKNRLKRKHEKAQVDEGRKKGMSVPLLEVNEVDRQLAEQVTFQSRSNPKATQQLRRMAIQQQSIFTKPGKVEKSSRSSEKVKSSGALRLVAKGTINVCNFALK